MCANWAYRSLASSNTEEKNWHTMYIVRHSLCSLLTGTRSDVRNQSTKTNNRHRQTQTHDAVNTLITLNSNLVSSLIPIRWVRSEDEKTACTHTQTNAVNPSMNDNDEEKFKKKTFTIRLLRFFVPWKSMRFDDSFFFQFNRNRFYVRLSSLQFLNDILEMTSTSQTSFYAKVNISFT